MKFKFLSISLLALLLLTLGCKKDGDRVICIKAEGPVVERSYDFAPLSGVVLHTYGDVYLTQNDTQSVSIQGQENILDNLILEVQNGILHIREDQCSRDVSRLDIHLSIGTLREARLTGSGSIQSQGSFSSLDAVTTAISGSGSINLSLACNSLDANISGSGDITLSGFTSDETVSISGAGNLQAFDLIAQDVEVSISGSGHARVWTENSLDASISGNGNVYYKGFPAVLISAISGSGQVIDAN